MSTETKEKQSATLIRNVVKMWDDEYSKKSGMRPTELKANAIDKEKKIMHKNNSDQFFAKIELSKDIDPFDLYYHFDLNENKKKPGFYIRLKYRKIIHFKNKMFNFSADNLHKFISKSKFKDIDDIPLNSEERGLVLDKNLIGSTPKFICDCMEELIRLTQKPVCEYINENKLKI